MGDLLNDQMEIKDEDIYVKDEPLDKPHAGEDKLNLSRRLMPEKSEISHAENMLHCNGIDYSLIKSKKRLMNTRNRDKINKTLRRDKKSTANSIRCTENKNSVKHLKIIKKGNRCFTCTVCEQDFVSNCSLEMHILTHTGERPFSCIICGKGFTQPGNLKAHEMTHSGEKPYACDICGKSFTQKGNFNSHKFIHTGKKPYKCSICRKTFAQKGNLETHSLNHSANTKLSTENCLKDQGKIIKIFSCDDCGKKFRYESKFKAHKLKHTKEFPYSCEICGKRYKTIMSHKLHHTGEKLVACKICGAKFVNNILLSKHSKTHIKKIRKQKDINSNGTHSVN